MLAPALVAVPVFVESSRPDEWEFIVAHTIRPSIQRAYDIARVNKKTSEWATLYRISVCCCFCGVGSGDVIDLPLPTFSHTFLSVR